MEIPTTNFLPSREVENELVDLQTIHGCSLENHSHCEIEMFSKFSDGRNLRTWTYGDRKTPATISGISAWGISLGGEFAMSDNPIQEIAEEGKSAGKLLFGGKELTYNTAAEKDYFREIIEDTERRAKRDAQGLNYSLIMGSDGSVSSFLRLKYEIHPEPKGFGGLTGAWAAAFDSLSSKGSLLKIESKAENDYLVELLSKHLKETNSSIPGRNPQEVPWTWLGQLANRTKLDLIMIIAIMSPGLLTHLFPQDQLVNGFGWMARKCQVSITVLPILQPIIIQS